MIDSALHEEVFQELGIIKWLQSIAQAIVPAWVYFVVYFWLDH